MVWLYVPGLEGLKKESVLHSETITAASAHRAHRLRACGNGVVPQAAAYAFRVLWCRIIEAFSCQPVSSD